MPTVKKSSSGGLVYHNPFLELDPEKALILVFQPELYCSGSAMSRQVMLDQSAESQLKPYTLLHKIQ